MQVVKQGWSICIAMLLDSLLKSAYPEVVLENEQKHIFVNFFFGGTTSITQSCFSLFPTNCFRLHVERFILKAINTPLPVPLQLALASLLLAPCSWPTLSCHFVQSEFTDRVEVGRYVLIQQQQKTVSVKVVALSDSAKKPTTLAKFMFVTKTFWRSFAIQMR